MKKPIRKTVPWSSRRVLSDDVTWLLVVVYVLACVSLLSTKDLRISREDVESADPVLQLIAEVDSLVVGE